jgi:hypothetical protein
MRTHTFEPYECVRLNRDLPELNLTQGTAGGVLGPGSGDEGVEVSFHDDDGAMIWRGSVPMDALAVFDRE